MPDTATGDHSNTGPRQTNKETFRLISEQQTTQVQACNEHASGSGYSGSVGTGEPLQHSVVSEDPIVETSM